MIYTRENWQEMIAARDSGEVVEVNQDIYWYFLEVLPPAYMGRTVTLPNGQKQLADYGFAEGYETVTAFWQVGPNSSDNRQYFCCRTREMNPHA